MINDFNKLPWHDAVLEKVVVDRQDEDIIQISIQWPEGERVTNSIIEFHNCYSFQANMNFGITPPDNILSAECIMNSEELDEMKRLWSNLGVNLSGLCLFKIVTNSTNSVVKIFSLGFRSIEKSE